MVFVLCYDSLWTWFLSITFHALRCSHALLIHCFRVTLGLYMHYSEWHWSYTCIILSDIRVIVYYSEWHQSYMCIILSDFGVIRKAYFMLKWNKEIIVSSLKLCHFKMCISLILVTDRMEHFVFVKYHHLYFICVCILCDRCLICGTPEVLLKHLFVH